MTTIAYRNGIMAADTLAIHGDTMLPGAWKKLHRMPDGSIAGCSGDALETAKAIMAASGPNKLKITGFGDSVLTVSPEGRLMLHQQGHEAVIEAPFFAIGSGATAALAALHMGASAVQAVKIACKVSASTGGKVRSMRIKKITDR